MAMTMEIGNFLSIVNNKKDVECFLILIGEDDEFLYYESENFKEFIY